MLPDVERGGAPGVTKFEKGSWLDAEPRSAVLTSRGLDRLSLPWFLQRLGRSVGVREYIRARPFDSAPIVTGGAGPDQKRAESTLRQGTEIN
jgi:hypothetical protein